MKFLLPLLLSSTVYAGPYAGLNLNVDNDRGFCEYKDIESYCSTVRGFAGYDTELSDSLFFDAHMSYEEQLDGDAGYNPTKASATIMKRW